MNFFLVPEERIDSINRKLDRLLGDKEDQLSKTQLLTNSQVAKLLGVCARTLQNYRDTGKITFSQVGRKIFYQESDINLFIQQNQIQPNGNKS